MKARRLFVALCLVAACSADNHPDPHAGTLTLRLINGGTNDGALVLVISGGPVAGVTAGAGYVAVTTADGSGTHLLLTGNIAPGPLAAIAVPDLSQLAAYTVTVEQAADRSTFALLDPIAYRAEVVR
ncbi:MAG TPA: hypothetical protein VGM77_11030 [Gemmatimonadales bacterium]